MPEITPDLQKEINEFASLLSAKFAQPEFIPGCQVVDVGDINEYATNNGWVEAICGQHNRQRVRWKSAETVGTASYIDVVHFPDRRLFEAWGLGGAGAVPGSGGGWPFDNDLTVDQTNADADYSTIAAAQTAADTNDILMLGPASYTESAVTISKNISVQGRGRTRTIISNPFTVNNSGADLTDLYIYVSGSGAFGLKLQSTSGVRTVMAEHWSVTDARAVVIEGSMTLRDVYARSNGSSTSYAMEVASTGAVLLESDCYLTGGGTGAHDLYIQSGGSAVLNGCILANGTIGGDTAAASGWYRDNSGRITVIGGVWLYRADGIRKQYADFDAAYTAAGDGDTIRLFSQSYNFGTSSIAITKAITVEGDGPEATIITLDIDDTAAFNLNADDTTLIFRNLSLQVAGDTGGVGALFTDNSGAKIILDNVIARKTTGASTTGYGAWLEAGTLELRNGSKLLAESGTSQYGIMNLSIAADFIIGPGCEVGGATQDVYGAVTASTLVCFGLLTNGLANWAGVFARTNIQPVPTEPILLNGHPLIWQRGTSFATAADGQYCADRFIYNKSGAMVHTLSQSTDVPSVATIGCLLDYSILIDCTTVDAAIAAGDYTTIRTALEGYNFLKIAQQQFTLPFWVKATKTGVYCISFRNSGADRSYVVEYTVNAADTWEYKQVTVSPSPAAGTWDYTNGVGVYVTWALAAGSTYQTTANAWQTGNYVATSNQVNACDSTDNNFRLIVGDPVPGPYARPIAPNPFGSFQALLANCQRYFQKSFAYGTAPAQNVGSDTGEFIYIAHAAGAVAQRSPTFPYPVVMRAAPTLTTYNPNAANAQVRDRTAAADCSATATASYDRGFRAAATGAAGTAVGNLLCVHWTATADI